MFLKNKTKYEIQAKLKLLKDLKMESQINRKKRVIKYNKNIQKNKKQK